MNDNVRIQLLCLKSPSFFLQIGNAQIQFLKLDYAQFLGRTGEFKDFLALGEDLCLVGFGIATRFREIWLVQEFIEIQSVGDSLEQF
jgi:hypothetical protein